MFAPHHYGQVIMSGVGVAIWLAVLAVSIYLMGFATVWKAYLVPCKGSLSSENEIRDLRVMREWIK